MIKRLILAFLLCFVFSSAARAANECTANTTIGKFTIVQCGVNSGQGSSVGETTQSASITTNQTAGELIEAKSYFCVTSSACTISGSPPAVTAADTEGNSFTCTTGQTAAISEVVCYDCNVNAHSGTDTVTLTYGATVYSALVQVNLISGQNKSSHTACKDQNGTSGSGTTVTTAGSIAQTGELVSSIWNSGAITMTAGSGLTLESNGNYSLSEAGASSGTGTQSQTAGSTSGTVTAAIITYKPAVGCQNGSPATIGAGSC